MQVPKIPDNYLSRINKRRRKIDDALRNLWIYHQLIDPTVFELLVNTVRRALKLSGAYSNTIRESLMEFAGVELTDRVADMIALKMAGGYNHIRNGKTIKSFVGLPEEGEWAPVEIAEMKFGHIRNDVLYVEMTGLVMAGAAVGQEFKQLLPMKFVVSILATELGWPKYRSNVVHSDLVRTWFTGHLITDSDGKLKVEDFHCAPHQQKYNKQLRDERNSPCIRGYNHQCRTCPVGYVECPRATHRYTRIYKECKSCGEQSIFDPSEVGQTVCLLCRTKAARKFWRSYKMSLG